MRKLPKLCPPRVRARTREAARTLDMDKLDSSRGIARGRDFRDFPERKAVHCGACPCDLRAKCCDFCARSAGDRRPFHIAEGVRIGYDGDGVQRKGRSGIVLL